MHIRPKPLVIFLIFLISINITFIVVSGEYSKSDRLLSEINPDQIQNVFPDKEFEPKSFEIKLSSGIMKPSPMESGSILMRASMGTERKNDYHLVQFYNLSVSQYNFLLSNNVTFLGYVPDDTYILKGNKEIIQTIDSLRWIGTLNTEQKISPELRELLDSTNESKINITVAFFEPLDETQLNEIKEISENILQYGAPYDIIMLEIKITKIDDIANLNFVKWLSPVWDSKLMLDKSSRVISADRVWGMGNDASGVTVGIIDSGIQRNHPYFAGPDGVYGTGDDIVTIHYAKDLIGDDNEPEAVCGEANCADDRNDDNDYDANGNPKVDEGGHGVLVAGVISGLGTHDSRTIKGVSSDANLVIQRRFDSEGVSRGPNPGFNDIWVNILDRDNDGDYNEPSSADVISISWGQVNSNGVYDSSSQRVDDVTRGYLSGGKEVLVVVAAGNDGEKSNKKVTAPGTAKNALTVGASADFRNSIDAIERWKDTDDDGLFEMYLRGYDKNELYLMNYSSRGTNDNRIKPDILAPGSAITTSALGGTYQSVDGTSFAAPHAAAVAAQILHNYPSASPALIKSMIIASAYGGGTTDNPNIEKAWGRLDTYSAIYQTPDEYYDVYHEGTVGNALSGEPVKQGYNFDVPTGAKKLIITMVYSDDPGDPIAGILQNYLDLYMVTPVGSTSLPNGHETKVDDTTNNVEKYVITNPQAGFWQVWVEAKWLNDLYGVLPKTQDYALNIRIIKESQTPDTVINAYKSKSNVGLHETFTVYGNIFAEGLSKYDVYAQLDIPHGLMVPLEDTYGIDGTDANMDVLGDIPADSSRATKTWTLEAYEPGTYSISLHVYGARIDDIDIHKTASVTVRVCDNDNDGYYDHNCGGSDCNDGNPNINPGQSENCNNGIDDDCDGAVDADDLDCIPECSCGQWQDQGCEQGSCAADEMYQTRSCSPSGCSIEERCISHEDCGTCDYSSYGTCASAYEMQLEGKNVHVRQHLCGDQQFFKVTTTGTCDIEWNVKSMGERHYYLYTKWDSSCPSDISYDCYDYTTGSDVMVICIAQDLPPGTYYMMANRYQGSGGYYSAYVSIDCQLPCEPEPETCDGIDNNCNGQIDEGLFQVCGSGECTGTEQCSNGQWSECSSSGNDVGVCAVCDPNGNPVYDGAQDSDCSPTSCPSDACGLGGCGLHIFADFSVSAPNQCSGLYACTSNACTATCETDQDNDGYSSTAGTAMTLTIPHTRAPRKYVAIIWTTTVVG